MHLISPRGYRLGDASSPKPLRLSWCSLLARTPPTHTEKIKGSGEGGKGGGCQEQSWGGVELGPRWQNFRYLRYATLTADPWLHKGGTALHKCTNWGMGVGVEGQIFLLIPAAFLHTSTLPYPGKGIQDIVAIQVIGVDAPS